MAGQMCAEVYIDAATLGFDRAYTYLPPEGVTLQPGQRVLVPFGRGNKTRQGVVTALRECDESERGVLKPIHSVIDERPQVSPEMVQLAHFISERTFCTYYEAFRPLLPIGINVRLVASYTAVKSADSTELTGLQREVYELLSAARAPIKRERLLEQFGEQCPLEQLEKRGLIERTDSAVRRVGDASVRMVQPVEPPPGEPASDKQKAVLSFLQSVGSASIKESCYYCGVTQSVINTLIKNGFLIDYENEVYRSPYTCESEGEQSPIALTDEQRAAYEGLDALAREDEGRAALLYGVTGSGKTQVYLRLIDDAIARGCGVIVMVPEIALTPQTTGIFQRRYGNRVAVFHSAMSIGQRTDEWKRVSRGEALIAIGTRSAVFAPVQRLGLIIMDEEQEHTYKSESTPRYSAKDVAGFRCRYHRCLFVMASATPSVETFSLCKSGRLPMFRLKNRYGTVQLPKVQTVNMREQYAAGRFDAISAPLVEAIGETLEQGRQSILLLNRRGYHTFVTCRSCGNVKSCPNCSISLTYHSANNRLMCHYCGYSERYSDSCEVCSQKQMKLSGYGTQKAQEELQALFPEASILRMDADTTMTRFSHERLLGAFAAGEYNIMVGTQMVAKGLDFPNVTLVGVINADQSLYSGDFRSVEKTFSLLTQVVGRSGRGRDEGTAIIQTISPESEIIWQSARQDYDSFYETEILSRKYLVYPPYCDLLVLGFSGEGRDAVESAAESVFEYLKLRLCDDYKDLKVIILGPTVCSVPKISNHYRYRLILKCKNSRRLRELITAVLQNSGGLVNTRKVSVFADINPDSIL